MKKPDFVIGGATRSGSGKLRQILSAHPRILMPELPDELFFRKNMSHAQEVTSPTTQPTAQTKTEILRGEWEVNPEKVKKYCPDAKIVFTLRNPVTRAYSQYWKARLEGKEKTPSFEEALDEEISGKRKPDTNGKCWIFKNQYQLHLDEWFSMFKREQILILIMEEWIDFPEGGLAPLELFLELDKYSLRGLPETKPREPRKAGFLQKMLPLGHEAKMAAKPPLSNTSRNALEDIFVPDKLYVASILDRYEIEAWRRK